jgi:thiamine pyrophosphate-dependent acetolactate synthase large subunit-like protein
MAKTAAEILVDTLLDWGVEVIFGLPGDGINGIMEALRNRQDDVRFIQVRHEEAAAFMACGYAKYTGKLGVCLETPGPVLIEAVVDPFEPPMPPKITVEQAAHFAESLARGEPNRTKIALTVLRDKVKELL